MAEYDKVLLLRMQLYLIIPLQYSDDSVAKTCSITDSNDGGKFNDVLT